MSVVFILWYTFKLLGRYRYVISKERYYLDMKTIKFLKCMFTYKSMLLRRKWSLIHKRVGVWVIKWSVKRKICLSFRCYFFEKLIFLSLGNVRGTLRNKYICSNVWVCNKLLKFILSVLICVISLFLKC